MIKLHQTLLVVWMLALTGVAPAARSPRVMRFMGARAAETVSAATRAEVFRVKDKRANEGQEAVGGYLIEAAADEQGEPFARRLATALLDEKSYRFVAPRKGGFAPRYGARLRASDRYVEVLLSPTTDEVVVFSPNPDDDSVRSAKANVEPASAALLALMKEAMAEE